MPVIFHRLAAAEFVDARRWYRERSPSVESRFATAVDEAVRFIETTPQLGAPFLLGRYRWVRARRFPYLLYYASTEDSTQVIYAAAHARRRLAYWLRRTNKP